MYDQKESELKGKLETVEQELFESNEINDKLREELKELRVVNSNLLTKNSALANSLATTADELNEIKVKQVKLEEIAIEHEVLKSEAGDLVQNLTKSQDQLVESQNQLYHINMERMALHNMVLDLRGNIRVFARVRPPLKLENEKMRCQFAFTDEASMEITSTDPAQVAARKQTKHDFVFDHVFDPNTSQDEIFEMVLPLIQSALDGYNICIFAYGEFCLLLTNSVGKGNVFL